jgi:uncharacterized protein
VSEIHLLDVSVLIARADPEHPSHRAALEWMRDHSSGWATCPITENGMLRILGHANYPGGGTGSPKDAVVILEGMISIIPGHRFILDDFSVLEILGYDTNVTSNSLTDIYLLSLAVRRGIGFLTLARRIDSKLVSGGNDTLEFLD